MSNMFSSHSSLQVWPAWRFYSWSPHRCVSMAFTLTVWDANLMAVFSQSVQLGWEGQKSPLYKGCSVCIGGILMYTVGFLVSQQKLKIYGISSIVNKCTCFFGPSTIWPMNESIFSVSSDCFPQTENLRMGHGDPRYKQYGFDPKKTIPQFSPLGQSTFIIIPEHAGHDDIKWMLVPRILKAALQLQITQIMDIEDINEKIHMKFQQVWAPRPKRSGWGSYSTLKQGHSISISLNDWRWLISS